MPLAYSYLRFSSPQQADGDSLRRQTESREKWLTAHPGIPLDTSLVLEDRGRSAFRRKDWDTYALAEFLRHVESGRVAAGSYLLVENLDRLSREHVRTGVKLFIGLLDHKINIVTLCPERLFRHDSQDLTDILTSRAAIGEYVPYQTTKRSDKPVGEPVPGYYPAVVNEETFHAVRAALAVRAKVGRGRRGKHINLFAGLLRDARDGGTITYCHRGASCELVPVSVLQRGTQTWASFPAVAFEDAILSKLREVRAADVEGDRREASRMVEAIAGEYAEAEQKAKWYKTRCDAAKTEEDFNLFADNAGEWERKRKALAADLEHAQREAASPLSESWGEFRSLAELLAEDKSDDLRIRARAALRRTVESVHCLFVGKRVRLAAVRVQFHGECYRQYLIAYTPGRSNQSVKRPGQWSVETIKKDGKFAGRDLRNTADAAAYQKLLVKHLAEMNKAK
jgi:hypothetical protein